MDTKIVIDDDFTLDVVEEEDEEEICSEDTFESAVQPECDLWNNTNYVNDVYIKQELEIDCEDNYLIEDKFVNLTEIKTEIDSETECEETAHDESLAESESLTQVDGTPDSVPEKCSNTEETVPNTQNNVIPEEIHDITSTNLILCKEPTPETQNQEKCTTEAKTQNLLSQVESSQAPLDRRRNYINRKNKKSDRRPTHFRHMKKLSPQNFHRNYAQNGNDSFLPKPFFTKKWQRNFGRENRDWRNRASPNANFFQSPMNSFQNGSVNWQTYSTILSALNQLLGNNQNAQSGNNFAPVYQKRRQFLKSKTRVQLRDRPQVWANEYQSKAPCFDSAARLQMCTTILSAVTELNNRVVMQGCPNYTSLNRVELQMSCLNIFGSL